VLIPGDGGKVPDIWSSRDSNIDIPHQFLFVTCICTRGTVVQSLSSNADRDSNGSAEVRPVLSHWEGDILRHSGSNFVMDQHHF